jgi:hypothetical protein
VPGCDLPAANAGDEYRQADRRQYHRLILRRVSGQIKQLG